MQVRVGSIKQGASIAKTIAAASVCELVEGDLEISFPTREMKESKEETGGRRMVEVGAGAEEDEENISVLSFGSARSVPVSRRSHQSLPLRELSFTNRLQQVGSFLDNPLAVTSLVIPKIAREKAAANTRADLKALQKKIAMGNVLRCVKAFFAICREESRIRRLFNCWKAQYNNGRRIRGVAKGIETIWERHITALAFQSFIIFWEQEKKLKGNVDILRWRIILSMTRKTWRKWNDAAVKCRRGRLMTATVLKMQRVNLRVAMRRWRTYSVIMSCWLVMLSFHKLKRLTQTFLVKRGRGRARRSSSMKRRVFNALVSFASLRKTNRRMMISCLMKDDKRRTKFYWNHLKLQTRAMAVLSMRRRNSNIIILRTMQIFSRIREVQTKWRKIQVFDTWRKVMGVRSAAKLFLCNFDSFLVGNFVREWRRWTKRQTELSRMRRIGEERLMAACLRGLRRVVRNKRAVIGYVVKKTLLYTRFLFETWRCWVHESKLEKLKWVKSVDFFEKSLLKAGFEAFLTNLNWNLRYKRNLEKAIGHWSRVMVRGGLWKLWEYRARRKHEMNLVCRGKAYHEEVVKLDAMKRWMTSTEISFLVRVRNKEVEAVKKKLAMRQFLSMIRRKRCWVRDEDIVSEFRKKRRRGLLRRVLLDGLAEFTIRSNLIKTFRGRKQSKHLAITFAHWTSRIESSKKKRRMIALGKNHFEKKALKKFLLRFAYFSLRISAGFQIADRFRAQRLCTRWSKRTKSLATQSDAIEVAVLFYRRRARMAAIDTWIEFARRRIELKYLYELFVKRPRKCRCTVLSQCFYTWKAAHLLMRRLKTCLLGLWEGENRKDIERGFGVWKRLWLRDRLVRNIFCEWKKEVGKGAVVGLFARRKRLRRGIKMITTRWLQKILKCKADLHRKTKLTRKVVDALRANVFDKQRVFREQKVRRKSTIDLLPLAISTFERKRGLNDRRERRIKWEIFNSWHDLNFKLIVRAKRRWRSWLLKCTFTAWKLLESKNREQRWIAAMRKEAAARGNREVGVDRGKRLETTGRRTYSTLPEKDKKN